MEASRRTTLVRVLLVLITVVAVGDWIRWGTDIAWLPRACTGWRQMKPWVSLWVVLLGTAALVSTLPGRRRWRDATAVALCLGVGATAVVTIGERLLGLHSGFDRLWFGGQLDALECTAGGQPARGAAIAALLLAVSIGLVRASGPLARRGWMLSNMAATALMGVGVVLYAAASSGFGVGIPVPDMSLTGAVLMLGLATVTAFQRADASPTHWFMEAPERAHIGRVLIVLLVFPVTMLLAASLFHTLGVEEQAAESLAIVLGTLLVALMVHRFSLREGQARARTEERVLAVLEALPDPVLVLEAVRDDAGQVIDFRIADCNAMAVRMSQLPRNEFIGQRLGPMIANGHIPEVQDQLEDVLDSGRPLLLDAVEITRRGSRGRRFVDIRVVQATSSAGLVFTWREMTEQHQMQQALQNSEAHYRLMADNSADVIVRFDPAFAMEWVSNAVTRVLGWSPEDLVGRDGLEFVHPDDLEATVAGRARLAASGHSAYRTRLRCQDGRYRWIGVRSRAIFDDAGALQGISATWRDIDREVQAEQRLDVLARTDALTGLSNRTEIFARIDAGLRQDASRGFGLLFCDMDNLKQLNDEHGHAIGDEVLRVLAARLTAGVRAGDTVARLGGDEFLIALSNTTGLEEAASLAERLRHAAAAPMLINGREYITSLSIGVVIANAGEDVDHAVTRADRAMYEAKAAGRNRVVASAAT